MTLLAATLPPMADVPPRWRERLLPKSVLGMAMLLVVASVGAAFSGAVLYAYYDYRLNQNERRVSHYIPDIQKRFKNATSSIDKARDDAKKQIDQQLAPLKKIAAEGETLSALLKKVAPSVWFVHTLDDAGQPSVGAAFVVAADATQAYLLTSYTAVRAATRQPGPAVFVRQGDEELKATLWTWQEDHDLAVLVIARPNAPKLDWASGTPGVKLGDRVFAVSGLGAGGGAISQGFVADVSAQGIQHDAAVGAAFQGGPLVDSDGHVVAVASRAYAPLGFDPGTITWGVPIRSSCDKVLRCPGGTASGAGQQRPRTAVPPPAPAAATTTTR